MAAEMQKFIRDNLNEMDFEVTEEARFYVRFRYLKKRGTYQLLIDREDPGYFFMVYPNFWDVTDGVNPRKHVAEQVKLLSICNKVACSKKNIKMFTKDGSLACLAYELHLGDWETYQKTFRANVKKAREQLEIVRKSLKHHRPKRRHVAVGKNLPIGLLASLLFEKKEEKSEETPEKSDE